MLRFPLQSSFSKCLSTAAWFFWGTSSRISLPKSTKLSRCARQEIHCKRVTATLQSGCFKGAKCTTTWAPKRPKAAWTITKFTLSRAGLRCTTCIVKKACRFTTTNTPSKKPTLCPESTAFFELARWAACFSIYTTMSGKIHSIDRLCVWIYRLYLIAPPVTTRLWLKAKLKTINLTKSSPKPSIFYASCEALSMRKSL